MSLIALGRKGVGARFVDRDKDTLRAVRLSLGTAEAAFRASALGTLSAGCVGDPYGALGLSCREAQVARMIARGLQNKEIAQLLGTSPDTVRKQTIRIYAKARVEGRVQLALRLGCVPPERLTGRANGVLRPCPDRARPPK